MPQSWAKARMANTEKFRAENERRLRIIRAYSPDGSKYLAITPGAYAIALGVAFGLGRSKIAEVLDIKPGLVKKHMENIYAKTGLQREEVSYLLGYQDGAKDHASSIGDVSPW